MNGTILAVGLALAVLVVFVAFGPQRVQRTEDRHSDRFVTVAELEARLGDFEKRTEWALSEWYDKFSTLHARAEKRVQRDRIPPKPPQTNGAPDSGERPSVLQLRKPWSV